MGQRRCSRGRRCCPRVQHHRRLRRHYDGHVRHDRLPRESGSGGGLHRVGGPGVFFRRCGDTFGLRQDHPGNRDGDGPPESAVAHAVWGVDPAGAPRRQGRDDSGRFRGYRRLCGRPDHAGGVGFARARCVSGRGCLRRPVHRQHHGHRVRGDGCFAHGEWLRSRRRSRQGGGRARVWPAGGRVGRIRTEGARPHHQEEHRERDRGRRRDRRIDQRRASSACARARSGGGTGDS